MRGKLLALASLLIPCAAAATPWQFEEPLPLTTSNGEQLFHHLESSGRRNVAVSGDVVAAVWEDDRDGTPRIYLARKRLSDAGFSTELRLSGAEEAYEPSLAALGGGRFAVAWEEAGRVHLRVVAADGMGKTLIIGEGEAAQPSLAVHAGQLLLVATERTARFSRIMLHRLQVTAEGSLIRRDSCAVDALGPVDEQLYPTLAVQQGRLLVAWEDRRPGHTIIMAGESALERMCAFAPPQRISLRPKGERDAPYGRGHGVARVALAPYGADRVLAAWADKRDFREGYDIYGAQWTAQQGFGDNRRVQDDFGGVARQWHATVSGDAEGTLVVAWDDERDGDANVMMSWQEEGQWSEDVAIPGADGPGEQAHPSITLDAAGDLHVVWVERDEVGGATRLYYTIGRRQ
ncbi:MAG TPA: hypothetical protein VIQ22_01430 [Gammaproteobacteria bacterium]